MRVLLTGGGTAGHINPALAIAETILRNAPGSVVEFVGVAGGKEDELVPRAGYKLHHVKSTAVQGSKGLGRLKSLALAATSPYLPSTVSIIKKFKPDIVIGTGGYVCWPLLKAASLMGVPTIVHESNAIAGVAVKQLKNKVDVIMTNFESTADNLKAKAKVMRVGNPISADFGRIDKAEARRALGIPESVGTVILSCGGSLGARKVNEAALTVMRDIVSVRSDVMHFHASGRNDAEFARQTLVDHGLEGRENIVMSEYIYNMPTVMAAADIVICRAGAMTLSELAAVGKAAVIIPSPNVTDNHQYKNAKVLADADAAVLIEEKELTDGRLTAEVERLVRDADARAKMENNISAFASKNVGRTIYGEICRLVKEKK